MFNVSPKVDKVLYSLCTNITITSSNGATMYTFVAPDNLPYSLIYYCLHYHVFTFYSKWRFNEEELIEWLRKLAKDNRKED